MSDESNEQDMGTEGDLANVEPAEAVESPPEVAAPPPITRESIGLELLASVIQDSTDEVHILTHVRKAVNAVKVAGL